MLVVKVVVIISLALVVCAKAKATLAERDAWLRVDRGAVLTPKCSVTMPAAARLGGLCRLLCGGQSRGLGLGDVLRLFLERLRCELLDSEEFCLRRDENVQGLVARLWESELILVREESLEGRSSYGVVVVRACVSWAGDEGSRDVEREREGERKMWRQQSSALTSGPTPLPQPQCLRSIS